MKRSFALLVVICTLLFSAHSASAERYYAGINFGRTQSGDQRPTSGLLIGVNREYSVIPGGLMFQVGIQGIQRSYQSGDNTFSYMFAEIPAVLKLTLGSALLPRLVAGMNLGFNFYRYAHNTAGGEVSAPSTTPMEYAAEIGFDEDFTSTFKFPFIQFRYHVPLSLVSYGVKLTGMSLALGFPF